LRRTIFDDDGLAELRSQGVAHDADRHVGAATGWKRNDHANGALGKSARRLERSHADRDCD
jgi:hypothetical protein